MVTCRQSGRWTVGVALLVGMCWCWPSLSVAAVEQGGLVRIIAPVRLSPQLGPRLVDEVTRTRAILVRFQNAGFQHAIWVVREIPHDKDKIKPWAETCLHAFPGKPILALEALGEGETILPETGELEVLLDAVRGAVDSVMINFSAASNLEVGDDEAWARKAARRNMRLINRIGLGVSTWLYVSDEYRSQGDADLWLAEFGRQVDGLYLYHTHSWNPGRVEKHDEAVRDLLQRGKPVILGGFRYTCPRRRPGIERDIKQNYIRRIPVYEAWIEDRGCAGYAREIGRAVPNAVQVNRDFVLLNSR